MARPKGHTRRRVWSWSRRDAREIVQGEEVPGVAGAARRVEEIPLPAFGAKRARNKRLPCSIEISCRIRDSPRRPRANSRRRVDRPALEDLSEPFNSRNGV